MLGWMRTHRVRLTSFVVGSLALLTVGCGTVQGFGEDLSQASQSVRQAFVGSDPDAPPLD